jgi:Sec-independent protein translocase protein TatA
MTGILKILLVVFLVFFISRLVKLIAKYRSSSRQTLSDLENQQQGETEQFGDVEDADYKEIPPENKKESEDNEV